MKWDKEFKEKIQYGSAIGMLIAGVAMAFLSLAFNGWRLIPDGVLWFVSQTLIYAGTIFGFAMVINYKFGKIQSLINGKNKTSTSAD